MRISMLLIFISGCMTMPTNKKESWACYKICQTKLKESCKSVLFDRVICDCEDGRRIKIERWD